MSTGRVIYPKTNEIKDKINICIDEIEVRKT